MSNNEKSNANVFSVGNFRLVFFGALVSELGATLYSFAVSFYILEISNNNAFLQGLYLALCGVMLLFFTPIGGVLGDRFNKAKIMFICDYIKGALIIAATVMMMIFKSKPSHIVILFFIGIVGNMVSGIFNPASGAILPDIVHEEKLQQANSYFSIKNALNSIVGIILAGILYSSLSVITLFFIVGVCYILSAVSEMFIRYTHLQREGRLSMAAAIGDVKEGLVYLRAQKALMVLMAAIMFINFFFSPLISNFLPFFIKTDVATAESYMFDSILTPEMWSSVSSVLIGLSTMIGAIVLSTRKKDDLVGQKIARHLCVIAAFMVVVSVGYWVFVVRGISLNAFLLTFCISSIGVGFMIIGINIRANTKVMTFVDKDKLSKVGSFISMISQGIVPISSVLAGLVLQLAGSLTLLSVCTIGFTATSLFVLLNKRTKEI